MDVRLWPKSITFSFQNACHLEFIERHRANVLLASGTSLTPKNRSSCQAVKLSSKQSEVDKTGAGVVIFCKRIIYHMPISTTVLQRL